MLGITNDRIFELGKLSILLGLGSAGLFLAIWGALGRRLIAEDQAPLESHNSGPGALDLVCRIRRVLVGLALLAFAAGVHAEWELLWMLALMIGGEQLLETSIMAAALSDQERARTATASS